MSPRNDELTRAPHSVESSAITIASCVPFLKPVYDLICGPRRREIFRSNFQRLGPRRCRGEARVPTPGIELVEVPSRARKGTENLHGS
jgi:hypothetical protein